MNSQTAVAGRGVDEAAITTFGANLRGQLIRPADGEYDEARQVWNGMIDRYPAFIARCAGAADVVSAVNFARAHGLPIAVRGGGHNVAGNAVCDGGIVIDLSEMRGVQVNPESRTARAEGGATWADLDQATQVYGLAAPGGVVSTTGIAGLTLHGGIGHLRRKHGLSIDNLRSVEIVTADGERHTASATENTDLFWAVRGAGSNFGVITSFEFHLHPVGPEIMLCAPVYDPADATTVVSKWRDFMATAPDEISSLALFWSMPADPHFPEELHGQPIIIVAAVYAGPADEGEQLMQPLRELATPLLDLSGQEAYTELQSGFDPFFPAGQRYYWKSLYANQLSDDLVAELARRAAERPSSLTTIDIWHHGGAMNRVGADETAFGKRDAPFLLSFSSTWTEAADDEANIGWARDGWQAIHQYSTGGLYLNFPGFGEEKEALVRAAYGANYDRLVALKTHYDPANLFRFNQNIKPSTTAVVATS